MKIHEYQAKAILKKYGVSVPRGAMAASQDEAEAAAKELFSSGATGVVVKAQIHAGGRGKGGGVKIAKSVNEAGELASKMLGMKLVTHQTGPEGRIVRRLLIEETLPIEKELYLGILVDRAEGKPVFMASAAGGMEIEQVAAENPDAILKQHIDPGMGLEAFQARKIAFNLGLNAKQINPAVQFLVQSLQGVSRHRCLAARDQSFHHDHRRPAVRARREDQLRRQRVVPSLRSAGIARHHRRRSAGSRGVEVQPELHQARRQRGLHGERRRAGDGDHGHHQVRGRHAGELPRRRRRRQLRAGRARVRNPAERQAT